VANSIFKKPENIFQNELLWEKDMEHSVQWQDTGTKKSIKLMRKIPSQCHDIKKMTNSNKAKLEKKNVNGACKMELWRGKLKKLRKFTNRDV
jgi:hypothetical protein